MNKVMWKVSGLLFVTSTLVGFMGGLLAAPRSGARTRKKVHRVYEDIKDQVKQDVHDLKGSVTKVAKQGNTYRKNWLSGKELSGWQQGFFEFSRIAPQKIVRWLPKNVQ
jgi:gas vesicle protein